VHYTVPEYSDAVVGIVAGVLGYLLLLRVSTSPAERVPVRATSRV
jgi:hypothetical protein